MRFPTPRDYANATATSPRLRIWPVAIAAGGGIDAAASFLLNLATSVFVANAHHLPLHLVPRIVFEEPYWILVLILIRLPFSVLGGFVAARTAGSQPFLHALLAGVAATCIRLLLQLLFPSSVAPWLRVVGILATLAMAGAGGLVGSLASPRRDETAA